MQLHLDHIPAKPGFELNHGHKIFMTGSCFSENIGEMLKGHRFNMHSNPNGILFNPASIHQCLDMIVDSTPMDEKYILHRDDIFLSFLHHSSVHDTDKKDLVRKINSENKASRQILKDVDCLIITFGSAFAYKHTGLNQVIANCHKQPQALFEKLLMDAGQITENYSELIKKLQAMNPGIKIIFTVSPVKYLKDGLVENSLSKSVLLLSVHNLVNKHKNCFYFPAYELVTDDLRDYRFYKEDLVHPNEQAIAYVWEKFSGCFFSEQTRLLNGHIQQLNNALNHRKLIANSQEAFKLRDYILKQKELIKNLNPGLEL